MTWRALFVGLVGSLLVAGFGYINNHVMRLERLESGHLIPVSVVGLLLLFVITLNPLLFRLRRRLAFRPTELAVVVMMLLIACSIPGRGLLEQFTSTIAMPMHWNRIYPSWERQDLLGYVPEAMFPADKRADPEVIDDYLTGRGTPEHYISLSDVPWHAWKRPLRLWSVLLILLAAASVCVILIVDRQWAEHERLPYPIAQFTASLMERDSEHALGAVFRQRLFWVGFVLVMGLRVWNGLCVWFPEYLVPVRLHFDFSPFGHYWPAFWSAPWGPQLFRPTIYPIVIAFSFFLAAEVSLSVGISQFLWVPIGAIFVSYGVDMSSSYMAGGAMGWHRSGSYLAFGVMILYVGRRYYLQVLRRSFMLPTPDEIDPHVTWACRILLGSLVLATAVIIRLGLDWPLAIGSVFLMMMMLLGVSRITAETGLFFIQPRWQPLGVFLGLMGAYALGPKALIVVGILCAVLSLDPSQAVMPYFANALRMCRRLGVSGGRVGGIAIGTYVIALAVGIVAVLWAQYNFGVTKYDWSYRRVPTMAFRPAEKAISQLMAQGALEESQQLSPIQRLQRIRPEKKYLWAAGTGVVLVLVVSFLRLRFPWWPLHPVVFLLWATYPIASFHHSFLLGWAIKRGITKYGGQPAYHKAKSLMTGVIAGELAGVLVFMIAGGIYYAVTQLPPKPYLVFPR